jgi:hypothetical protein
LFDAQKLLQTGEPQQPVTFTGLATAALAFQRGTRDPQPIVNIDRDNVEVGEHVAARLRIDVDGDAEPCEGSFGELQSGYPPFQFGSQCLARVPVSTCSLGRSLPLRGGWGFAGPSAHAAVVGSAARRIRRL